MAVSRIGSPEEVNNSSNASSTSITVPADCTYLAVAVTGYENLASYFSGGTLTLNGVGLTCLTPLSDDNNTLPMTTMWGLQEPDTGSQTLAWDWSGAGAPDEGVILTAVYLKGVDLTGPVRDADGGQAAAGTVPIVDTGVINSESGDYVLGAGGSYSVDGETREWDAATEFFNSGQFNQDTQSLAEATATGTIVLAYGDNPWGAAIAGVAFVPEDVIPEPDGSYLINGGTDHYEINGGTDFYLVNGMGGGAAQQLDGNAVFAPGLSWPQGKVSTSIKGNAVFQPALSWPQGAVGFTLKGVAWTPTLSWPQGTAIIDQFLTGNAVFTPGLSWPQGSVSQRLAGVAWTPALSWPTGSLNLTVKGVAWTPALSWPTGSLPQAQTLTGNAAFTPGLSWPQGDASQNTFVTGNAVFTPTLSWPTGSATLKLAGNATFLPTLSWPQGTVTPRSTLTGTLFTPGLVWPTGLASAPLTISGSPWLPALSWPTGSIFSDQLLSGLPWLPALLWPSGSIGFTQDPELTGISDGLLGRTGASPAHPADSASGHGLDNTGRSGGLVNSGKSHGSM